MRRSRARPGAGVAERRRGGASPRSSAISRPVRRGADSRGRSAKLALARGLAGERRGFQPFAREAASIWLAPRHRRQRIGSSLRRRPAGTAPSRDEDREAAALGDPGERAACVPHESATENGWSGSTRSRPWCGSTAAGLRDLRCHDVEAAEHLPESAEMISAGTPSARRAVATSSESPLLPVAVAPAMTRSGGTAGGMGRTGHVYRKAGHSGRPMLAAQSLPRGGLSP